MKRSTKIVAVFKRMETDAEFRDRLWKDGRAFPSWINASESLDSYAWGTWRVQRRLVEDVTER